MSLWGGRFKKSTDALVYRFNASLRFDKRLYDEDITGSIAWARGLETAGVFTNADADSIVTGLEQVRTEFQAGTFVFHDSDEDIHTAVERRLTELVGALAGKLHTGRSRNDQVATDFRLWIMRACDRLSELIISLQRTLVARAEADLNTVMPGYTHLQQAQPITWGHWTLSHFWPLERDKQRLGDARARAATLPLGSGALAGTTFPVDQDAMARDLGFTHIAQNSIDAVSDRDFAADFLYSTAMLSVHLSRLSEQLILFSSAEFGFVELDEAFATGSSLMPQKKNPDPLELTRGKSGRLIGNLTGLLATLKGLPSAYDKDLQEDKEPVFDAADTMELALPVMTGVVSTLQLRPERMIALIRPTLLATDLADYLVKRGVPFRDAHRLVGKVIRRAEALEVPLNELSLSELQAVSKYFEADAVEVFDIVASIARRQLPGGTAPDALKYQLQAARRHIPG